MIYRQAYQEVFSTPSGSPSPATNTLLKMLLWAVTYLMITTSLLACTSTSTLPLTTSLPSATSLPSTTTTATATATEISANTELYRKALLNPARSAEDLARDPSSQPEKILALMNLKQGMSVLDFQAGTGYFTELLSFVVGSEGKVLAHNHTQDGVLDEEVFTSRYGNNRLSNTEQIFARHNELDLQPESLDLILMSMVYHDTYWFSESVDWGPVDHQAFLLKLYDALKPGATILVIDHFAAAGTDPYESALITHRIDPAVVESDFLKAGFILHTESNILRNSSDNYSLSIFDEIVYRNTDRFIMLFQKH